VWVVKADRLHPPRETDRWTTVYRRRAAVEREFGRLKHEWGLTPLRVRGVERVGLHADLTILAQARLRAQPRAPSRSLAKRLDCSPNGGRGAFHERADGLGQGAVPRVRRPRLP
jgi:hypothetical protein